MGNLELAFCGCADGGLQGQHKGKLVYFILDRFIAANGRQVLWHGLRCGCGGLDEDRGGEVDGLLLCYYVRSKLDH